MDNQSSSVKNSYTDFQETYWRRSVGPWLSHFEPQSSSATSTSCTERKGYKRNAQGLWQRQKRQRQKKSTHMVRNANGLRYDPSKDEKIKGNPCKSVFIARLDYSTTEETLREVFCNHGVITHLRLVRDTKTGKSKGYAFVEFKESEDAKKFLLMYKQDGLRIDSREVLVDRVRAGIVPSWLPVRLGGGLGQRQKGTQRFIHKQPYFGDPSRMDHKEQSMKNKLWFEHQRHSMKSSSVARTGHVAGVKHLAD